MSELNVYHHELRPGEYAEFYLKYEADKIIAEKDKAIAKLIEIDSENRSAYYKDLAMMAKDVEHHKYKRCLAMAKWCNTKADWYYGIGRSFRDRVEFYIKWHKRWLKIADKVIAELTKACNDKDDWCLHTLKENRHNKYKRCLAMAIIYFNRAENANGWKEEIKARKRFKKWLELAEKFKPNKEAK